MNRKGMVAIMDAMIFVVLLTFVSLALLDFDTEEEEISTMDASDICEYVLSTDMTSSGLVPDMGNANYTMADAIAYATVNGSDRIMEEARTMIDGLTMGKYGYCITFTCNGHTESIGEINGVSGSSYSGTWTVTGGKDLVVEMWIHH